MSSRARRPARILFFLEGRTVPASRFRVEQYQKHLRERQIVYRNLYTTPSKYGWAPRNIVGTPLALPFVIFSILAITAQRIIQIVCFARRYDAIVLQRDLLYRVHVPFLEALLFWYTADLRRNKKLRVVFDVDDAIFLTKSGERSPALDRKLKYICSHCDAIIAGNKYLSSYFEKLAPTFVIPTVVDCVGTYVPIARTHSGKCPVVGWTGLATNLSALRAIVPALQQLAKLSKFKLLVITNAGIVAPITEGGFPVEVRAWTPDREISDLQEIDIGIMPLLDDSWSRGKCGFKLIQYMALAIPAVASDVGVNGEIIASRDIGRLAKSESEWVRGLSELLANPELRHECGQRARDAIVARYSVERWFESWLSAVGVNTGDHRL